MITHLHVSRLLGAPWVAAVLCLGLVIAPAAANGEAAPGPAGPMYTPTSVVVIDLTLPEASIDALEETPEEYRDGTFSLATTDGTPAGAGEASTPIDVGIRLKGQASFKTLAKKAAFKVKFNHSVKGQKFLGLKKLTLNNMVQDPSMIHEVLAYEVFRAAGVAAPRSGYAFVRVNGADYGVYLNVETFDDVALERWFGSTGHLYEGSYGSDVSLGGADAFEVDEGDEDDRGDLEELIAHANAPDGDWSEGMTGIADLEQMTRLWAVERYIGHWDGYTGHAGLLSPNNFYLHSDDAGLFSMLPWGADHTWSTRLVFAGAGSLMFERCLADASCRAMYRDSVVAAGQAIAGLDLDSLAHTIATLLGPWQALDPRLEHSLERTAAEVASTRAFIAARPDDLLAWLNPPESSLPATEPTPTGQPEAGVAAMRMGRSTVVDGALVTRLTLSRPGQVSQEVEIRTVKGPVRLCSVRIEIGAAGDTTVRCELSAAARRRLGLRWLRLRVQTRFTPSKGAAESATRSIVARRAGRVGKS